MTIAGYHAHAATSTIERCYMGESPNPQDPNPAAQGGITVIETCACGATRTSIRNQGHVERGPWVPLGPARQWTVYHGGSLRGLGRWSGPHRSLLEAHQSARRCRQVAGGSPSVEVEEVRP